MINIGSFDRIARFVLGAALLAAPFVAPAFIEPLGAWRFAVIGAGVVLIGTAAFRICPAYMLFGIRTCATSRA
jgi:hypothetical protein